MLLEYIYHLSSCIRVKTCITHGQKVAQLVPSTEFHSRGGWRSWISASGSNCNFILRWSTWQRLDLFCCFSMATTPTWVFLWSRRPGHSGFTFFVCLQTPLTFYSLSTLVCLALLNLLGERSSSSIRWGPGQLMSPKMSSPAFSRSCGISPSSRNTWERGFKSAGLVPFNPDAISRDRLSPSLVTGSGTPPDRPESSRPTTPPPCSVMFRGVGTVHVGETLIRAELRAYFIKVADKRGAQRRRRVELNDHGEELTSDQVLERLEQAEAEKARKVAEKTWKAAEKKSGKKGNKRAAKKSTSTQEPDSVHCGVCDELYTDDDAENWIGCDMCEAWFHFWCVGLEHADADRGRSLDMWETWWLNANT